MAAAILAFSWPGIAESVPTALGADLLDARWCTPQQLHSEGNRELRAA
jgi:hypothetical protein